MMTKTIDRAGIAISSLCIIHCVLLPLVTSTLPILGLLSENELFHKGLVLFAVIPAAFAFASITHSKVSVMIRLFGLAGVSLLFLGAFVERLHDVETLLTLIGATCLALAHLIRIWENKPHTHNNEIS